MYVNTVLKDIYGQIYKTKTMFVHKTVQVNICINKGITVTYEISGNVNM